MNRKDVVERAIHAYLQEQGYDAFVPADKVSELADRVLAALDGKSDG